MIHDFLNKAVFKHIGCQVKFEFVALTEKILVYPMQYFSRGRSGGLVFPSLSEFSSLL